MAILVGWIIIGFLAGALSGLVVRDRTAGGCLANILIGILGGLVGGFLAREFFSQSEVYGWIGALSSPSSARSSCAGYWASRNPAARAVFRENRTWP